MEKDNEYANIYQQMPGQSPPGIGQQQACCGNCGSSLAVAVAAPPPACHCLQIHHHPAGGGTGTPGATTHILHIHPHHHHGHHPHHRIQGLSSDSDYRSVYSSSSSLYSMPVFHQPPPPPPPPPPLPPQNPPQNQHPNNNNNNQHANNNVNINNLNSNTQQTVGHGHGHQLHHHHQQLVVDPSRLQMRSPVSSSAATYSDSSQYGTHSPIALIRDKVSDARKLVEYLPYHTAARCGGSRRGECDSSNAATVGKHPHGHQQQPPCLKYAVQGSLSNQQRRYLTMGGQNNHNHQDAGMPGGAISTISGAVITSNGVVSKSGVANQSASTNPNGATSPASAPSPSKLKTHSNPVARFFACSRLLSGADANHNHHHGADPLRGAPWVERRRAVAVSAALFLMLLLLGCGLVLYFTLGHGVNTRAQELTSPENVISVIFTEFRITNQEFLAAYNDSETKAFKEFSGHIQNQLDATFADDPSLVNEYLGSQVVGLLPGSVIVHAHIFLNSPFDPKGPDTLGLIFIRSLRNLHGRMWLGQFSIDIHSIMFTEVNKDLIIEATSGDARLDVDKSTDRSHPAHPELPIDQSQEEHVDEEEEEDDFEPPNWGPWGPWSTCNEPATAPCSTPRAVQDRTRTCNLDGGKGDPIDSIGDCLARRGGDIEVRECPCVQQPKKNVTASVTTTTEKAKAASAAAPAATSTTTSTTTSKTTTVSQRLNVVEAVEEEQQPSKCDLCKKGEVCVALAGEAYPTCRPPTDPADPTGCGGLCRMDREVCQRLDGDAGVARRCLDASLCLADEWKCRNGLCIPEEKRCDGHFNCYDHTDEMDCECDAVTQFQCGNRTSCLPIESRCNGFVDCWDGSDEANCTLPAEKQDCEESEHSCSNGQCIPKTYFCDGYKDCSDGTDEPIGCGGDCMAQEWRCKNGRCIKNLTVCDGYNTCGDNSDEMDCTFHVLDEVRPALRHSGCGSGSFKCSRGGACIPASSVCNGVRDCDDGSDESLCKPAVKGIDVPQATRLLS